MGSNGEVVERKEPEKVRQPISKQTSDTMCEILESVVSEGGGKNAYLAGYRIAGKTGTSEKIPRGNGKYIASFIGFAPADDPQVLCLVILDEPAPGRQYYGGMIAAPVSYTHLHCISQTGAFFDIILFRLQEIGG